MRGSLEQVCHLFCKEPNSNLSGFGGCTVCSGKAVPDNTPAKGVSVPKPLCTKASRGPDGA